MFTRRSALDVAKAAERIRLAEAALNHKPGRSTGPNLSHRPAGVDVVCWKVRGAGGPTGRLVVRGEPTSFDVLTPTRGD